MASLYGGLDENSMTPPSEKRNDYRSDRWKPTKIGNYFEIITPGGAKLRPVNTDHQDTSARIYSHAPGVEATPQYVQQNQIKLWVNEIVMGWSMDYREAQTVYGKSFYPRHIRYSDVIVRGQTANQKHYDEIVDAVVRFQEDALYGTSDVVRFELPRLAYKLGGKGPEMYQVAKPAEESYRTVYASLHFDGYLMGIKAGHRKGVFNPDFELRFAVVAYSGDNLIKASATRNIPELVDEYRKSLDTKTSIHVVAPDQVFETGYGPGGSQGPRS